MNVLARLAPAHSRSTGVDQIDATDRLPLRDRFAPATAIAVWMVATVLVASSASEIPPRDRAVVALGAAALLLLSDLGATAVIWRFPRRENATVPILRNWHRMTVPRFQAKWALGKRVKERSGSQEHFIDLCRLFGVPTPIEADPTEQTYAFEKGASKSTGGNGWADVWRRGFFAWEYKGPHADLEAAYHQLQLYLDDLENPPLLVVCDLDRFVIRTHFTNTPTVTYRFDLEGLSNPANLNVLRAVFTDPEQLRPHGAGTDNSPRWTREGGN